MIGIVGPVGLVVLCMLGVETLRWVFRPEARRLRVIKKIGGATVKVGMKFVAVDRSGGLLANEADDRRFWVVSRQAAQISPDAGATSFIGELNAKLRAKNDVRRIAALGDEVYRPLRRGV